MQIQLKQTEIVAALKQYITKQGINLTNKEVAITFTAGRKEGGLFADLIIEDIGSEPSDDEPEETPVTTPLSQTATIEVTDAVSKDTADEPASVEPDAVPVKTTSLFS